eukprot:NODE_340_length_10646_cov_0.202522.p4 type:complete len:222 gc:universal NODE_340_length_10646_cov_0.202522:10155-9490(-)
MGEKTAAFLRFLIAIPTLLSILFGIYQLVIAEWVTGAIWLIAGLFGTFSLCANNRKAVLFILAGFDLLLFAVFICHIVFLTVMGLQQKQLTQNYPGLSTAISSTFAGNLWEVKKTTHIIGIVASVVFILLSLPLFMLLANSLSGSSRKRERLYPRGGQSSYNQYDGTQYSNPHHFNNDFQHPISQEELSPKGEIPQAQYAYPEPDLPKQTHSAQPVVPGGF